MKNIKKLLLKPIILMVLIGIIIPSTLTVLDNKTNIVYASSEKSQIQKDQSEKDITIINSQSRVAEEEIIITNRDIFEALESLGYNVSDYLSAEQIEMALIEDQHTLSDNNNMTPMSNRGVNKLVSHGSGFYDLYLNGYIAGIALSAGVAVAAAALVKVAVIKAFMIAHPLTYSGIVGAITKAVDMILESVEQGVVIEFFSLPNSTITTVYRVRYQWNQKTDSLSPLD